MTKSVLSAMLPLALLSAWATGCFNLLPNTSEESAPSSPIDDEDGGFGSLVTSGATPFAPTFGATLSQANSPPPVSGGTLIVSRDGSRAIASDPDRDQVYIVDLASLEVTTLALASGDEPGRLVEDAAGRVHVAARSGGVVVTIDIVQRQIVGRQSVCSAPRGIDFDPIANNVYVACAAGELVTLPAAGGSPTRTVIVDRDLRDVIVGTSSTGSGSQIYVTRLKSAELLTIGADGSIVDREAPPPPPELSPGTAWRAIPTSAHSIAMVHQRATTQIVSTAPGGYGAGSSCESAIVESTLTVFNDGVAVSEPGPTLPAAVLPVDVAVSPDGSTFAVVSAAGAFSPDLPSVVLAPASDFALAPSDLSTFCETTSNLSVKGQPTAVAFTASGTLLVQTREPAALYLASGVVDEDAGAFGDSGGFEDAGNAGFGDGGFSSPSVQRSVSLSSVSRDDTGHDIFHANSGAFIACASCHAEGLEDGRVWSFDTTGPRRTQSLRGTLAGTAPYHWEGDLSDVDALMSEVFVQRMSGPVLQPDQVAALQTWLLALPPPPPEPSSASAERGSLLFADPSVGCSGCHSGPKLTNNLTLDVNTGGSFQVPSLVGVGWRAPYLHAGCAATLQDRFSSACTDGVSHGHTSNLDPGQIADLVSYLETL